VRAAVRKELGALASAQIAEGVRVRYGGSVNAKNIGDLIAQDDVEAALGDRCRKKRCVPVADTSGSRLA